MVSLDVVLPHLTRQVNNNPDYSFAFSVNVVVTELAAAGTLTFGPAAFYSSKRAMVQAIVRFYHVTGGDAAPIIGIGGDV